MGNTGPESTVPPATPGGGGAGLRPAGAAAGEERATLDLANPHAYLGAHADDGGVIVRALRPGARSVRVEPAGVELEHVGDGVWEGLVPGAEVPLDYELQVAYPDGAAIAVRDPYAFPPTLGELDVHLAGEGRHEEIYRRLGAHPTEVEGVAGTSFAVWAPNARAVSVVGDFNLWDGRLNPMRSLGSSGSGSSSSPASSPERRTSSSCARRRGSCG